MWISCLLVPAVLGKTFFSETFDHADAVPSAWVVSSVKEDYGSWGISAGKFFADPVTSKGLKTMDNARFYSISVALDETVNTADSDLVIQFSVKHEQSIDCGGGYVKLMPPSFKQAEFSGDSEYAVMFGPDICGTSAKVHSILSFDGTNHEIKNKIRAEKDQMTHLYTFVLRKDKTYVVNVDGKEVSGGKLTEAWDILPAETIPDPSKEKPVDWIDQEMIDDPDDKPPAGYDDIEETIPDPDAQKPEDWDDDDDGEFEPPRIPNPDYTGPFIPRQIKNPAYKGKWEQPTIPNPDYKEDLVDKLGIYEIAYLGLDLWQVKAGTIFDDFLITNDIKEAEDAAKVVKSKQEAEVKAKEVLDEEERKIVEAEEKKREEEEEKEGGSNKDVGDEEDEFHDEL